MTAEAQFHAEDPDAAGNLSVTVRVPIKSVGAADAALADALKSAAELLKS